MYTPPLDGIHEQDWEKVQYLQIPRRNSHCCYFTKACDWKNVLRTYSN